MTELDSLLDSARGAEPRPLDDRDLDRSIARAGIEGAARHRAWMRKRLIFAAAVGGAIAASIALAVLPQSEPRIVRIPAQRQDSTELELPSGDAITATPGTRFHVEEVTATSRRVRVRSGVALFDVRPLADGERFEVATRQLTARVVGTVFSVEARDESTIVRVYEGRVEIVGGRTIGAGESYESTGAQVSQHGPLEEEGIAAADRREPIVERPVREPRATRNPRPQPAPEPTASAVRRLIGAGRAEVALRTARDARRRGAPADPWAMLEGDALRALGRSDEAATVYENAIDELRGEARAQAGFLAANLRAASDPNAAIALLERSGADREGSPLRERALALEWTLFGSLDRAEDRRRVAEDYVEHFPQGSRADAIRAWIAGQD